MNFLNDIFHKLGVNPPRSQEDLRWYRKYFSNTREALKTEAGHIYKATSQELKKHLVAFKSNYPNWYNKAFTKNKKFWKYGAILGGLVIANNAISAFYGRPSFNKKVIPEEYDKGYDNIKEHLTDFGSPVRLDKVASKVLVPYFSSIRKGIKTTVGAIRNENIALYSSAHAIGHTRY